MRRTLIGLFAFLTLTLTVLVVPVYAAPAAEPEPVATSTDAVPLGSVADPAPDAEVQEGTTDPVAGVADTAPTLTLTRTDVAGFSLVGVTWAYDPAVTDTVTQVRVQDAAGGWGEWTEVLPETADQGPGADTGAELRSGTSPLWTGPSTGVEVELVTRGGAQPTDVQLDLVDPGTSDADTALDAPAVTDTAHADTTMPPVYSRAQWGADESIRSWAPEYASTIKAATVHHTADSNDYTADQVPAIMRSIYRYHAVSLGWGDIGYNVIVDKYGRLWEGRAGGLERAAIGAHAGGFNTYTFGVSMLGNYDIAPVPQATVESVAAIIAWKFSLFGVNPAGTTVLTSSGGGTARYAAGTKVTLPTIFAHRDVGSTVCPGQYGYARMGEIRDRVVSLMGGPDGPPSPAIEARYNADAGLRSLLGAKVGGTRSAGGTVWQVYAQGRLYYHPAGGVHLMGGAILERFVAAGGPAVLGSPVTDELGTPDGRGRYNHLTSGGSVYWTAATGAHVVTSAVRPRWEAQGWENGPLGYPTGDTVCGLAGSGCRQDFQGGQVATSPATGAFVIKGAIGELWTAQGRQTGALGYPLTDEACGLAANGCGQTFQNGSVFWSGSTGAHVVRGAVRDLWGAMGAPASWLGYPTTDEICGIKGGGCLNYFQGGSVVWSPATGVHPLTTVLMTKWQEAGWDAGVTTYGYPLNNVVCGLASGGCGQTFQNGSLFWSAATGAHVVRGSVRDLWGAMGAPDSWLGYPTTDEICGIKGGGCLDYFQGGTVLWSPATGVHPLTTALMDKWQEAGWDAGVATYGYPLNNVVCGLVGGGCGQTFQNGSLFWSAATGAHVVRGPVRDEWAVVGADAGRLGLPTTDTTCGLRTGGCFNHFANGSVYWSPASGAHVVADPIRAVWAAAGWENSAWGYPTGDVTTVPGGSTQRFQGGTATWNSTTGVVTLR